MTRRGWLLFSAMCLIWGVPYLLIRVAVREVTPATLVFARTAIAALLLVPLAARRSELAPLRPYWKPLVAFAAIEIAVPWFLLGSSETRISSSLAALLIAAVPLVGAVMATVTGYDDRLDRRRVGGLVVGIVGVAAIVGLDVGATSTLALIEIAGVVVCYAAGPIILSRFLSGLPGLGVIAASLALCALVYSPIAVVQRPSSLPSGHVLASVACLAIVCTALGFLIFFALITEAGPVRATVITYVNPAVAAVLGVAVLDESFTAGMAAGFVLVLIGSVLATRRGAPVTSDPVAECAEVEAGRRRSVEPEVGLEPTT